MRANIQTHHNVVIHTTKQQKKTLHICVVFIDVRLIESEKKMHETRRSQHVHQSIKSIQWWWWGDENYEQIIFTSIHAYCYSNHADTTNTGEKNQFYSSALWMLYICKHFMRDVCVCGSFARVFPTKWPYIGILWRLELERTLIFFIIIIITVIIIIIRAAWIALSSLFVCCCCMV